MRTVQNEIDERDRHTAAQAHRAAQLVQLQLASPMRPCGGRTQGTGGLALFDHAHQPRLL